MKYLITASLLVLIVYLFIKHNQNLPQNNP